MSLRDSFGATTNLKNSFALNLKAYNMFYLNRAFMRLFWLRSDSNKVVFIVNKYLNIYCIIISLSDSFVPLKSVKKSLRAETKFF